MPPRPEPSGSLPPLDAEDTMRGVDEDAETASQASDESGVALCSQELGGLCVLHDVPERKRSGDSDSMEDDQHRNEGGEEQT